MASPFGGFGARPATSAPPSSPFGFSAATSQPAFGAFGAAPAASAGFGAFGAAAAPSPFGAASSAATGFGGGLFGQAAPAASAGGLFGAAGSAPATGGLFGAASGAAATPSLFGAASSAAPSLFGAAASSSSLFGATGTGLFGASTPAGGLFGTMGAASSASPFSFNTTPATGGLFGTSTALVAAGQQQQLQQQQQQQAAAAAQAAAMAGLDPTGLTADDAVRSIQRIAAAYIPTSPEYRFTHLFLSVVDNPAQRIKPPQVDETRWRQALAQAGGPNNADRLWPVAASGFKDLIARSQLQVSALSENEARLKALQELAARLAARSQGELKERAAALQSRHRQLAHRLLHVTRCVDALESRLAATVGYQAPQARARDAEVARRLGGVEAELAPTAAAGLTRRLEAVAAAARLRAGGGSNSAGSGGAGSSSTASLDEKSLSQLFSVLRDHAEGVKQLQEVLRRDALDVSIMQRMAGGSDANAMVLA